MNKNNNSNNPYSKSDISKDLDDIFSNQPEEISTNNISQSSHKPISTIVGKAFDMMDQQMIEELQIKNENTINDKQPPRVSKSSSLINSLKKTVIGKVKANKEIEINKSTDENKSINNQLPKPSKSNNLINSLKKTVIGRVKTNKEVEIIESKISEQKNIKNSKKLYQTEESENDLFNDEGFVEDQEEVSSLKEVLDQNIKNFLYIFDKYTLKIKTVFAKMLLKLGIKSLGSVNKVLNKNLKKEISLNEEKKPIKEEIKQDIKEKVIVKGNFDDMASLNIIFTDNYDVALYRSNNNLKISKMEDDLIMLNVIESIKECAELTEGQPPIKEGMFKDQYLNTVMSNIDRETVKIYLGYVKSKPKKYVGKKWKISETYATWLMLGTPL